MVTSEVEASGERALNFNLPLLSKVGKPIPSSELVSRLKTLHLEISQFEQENVDRSSLLKVSKDLYYLVSRKDKGVRIFTACCLADIMRLFAPEPPYTPQELMEIFELFCQQLSYLKDVKDPFFSLYFYLLESLSTVKSAVLIVDLPNAEELISQYFAMFFESITQKHSKNVYLCILDILYQLLEECQTFPKEALITLLSLFRKKRKQESPASFRLAVDLCNQSCDHLLRPVCQHFSEIILTAKGNFDAEGNEELRLAHQLLLDVYEYAHGLLLNVVPQLEMELEYDDSEVRSMALNTFGVMVKLRGTEPTQLYPQVWKTWLNRMLDKQAAIRSSFVSISFDIIENHPEILSQLSHVLISRIRDPDDKIRELVCQRLMNLALTSNLFFLRQLDQPLLQEVGERCRDKKINVRNQAMETLSKIYSTAYSKFTQNELEDFDKFIWIPGVILNCRYTGDTKAFISTEKMLADILLPKTNDSEIRMRSLLFIFSNLDDKMQKAFFHVLICQKTTYHQIQQFLDMLGEDKNDEKIKDCISSISASFPESDLSFQTLQKFAQLNDKALINSLRKCASFSLSLTEIDQYRREFLTKMEKSFTSSSRAFFESVVRRISFPIINGDIILAILKYMNSNHSLSHYASNLLKSVAHHLPDVMEAKAEELSKGLDCNEEVVARSSLFALWQIAKNSFFPEISSILGRNLNKFIDHSDEDICKTAIKLLCFADNKLNDVIVEKLVENLFSQMGIPRRSLCLLSVIARYAPESFFQYQTKVLHYILEILLPKEPQICDKDWLEFNFLDDLAIAKIYGITTIRNVLMSSIKCTGEFESSLLYFEKLKALFLNGQFSDEGKRITPENAHLRLKLSLSLLKLSIFPEYDRLIDNPVFVKLALEIQDPCFHVRMNYRTTLMKYLCKKGLGFRYFPTLFLVVHDPESEMKSFVKMNLRQGSKLREGLKSDTLELSFPRLLHLLSHHPDFSAEPSDLLLFTDYIDFYLDSIATAENVSFLFFLATKLKSVQDVFCPNHSGNLYILSELAQLLIKQKSSKKQWSLQTYPVDIELPHDLFLSMDDNSEITKKAFLSREFEDLLSLKLGNLHRKSPHGTPVKSTRRHERRGKRQLKILDKEEEEELKNQESGFEDEKTSTSETPPNSARRSKRNRITKSYRETEESEEEKPIKEESQEGLFDETVSEVEMENSCNNSVEKSLSPETVEKKSSPILRSGKKVNIQSSISSNVRRTSSRINSKNKQSENPQQHSSSTGARTTKSRK